MTALDILFWLLVGLLGAIAWAIEAGLGQRYRNILASSVFAAAGSGLLIMFWVEDKTVYSPFEAEKFAKTKKKSGDGQLSTGETEEEKSNGKGGKDGAGAGAAKAADNSNGANGGGGTGKDKDGSKDGDADLDGGEAKIVYSREPFSDCPVCPDMIIVSSGVANVGSPPTEVGRTPDEAPPSTIPIGKAFAIGRIEILRSEFDAFVKQTRHESRGPCDVGKRRGTFNWQKAGFEQDERHPAVCVTWNDVRLYLAWLGDKTNRRYRLPNEIEWEYAARSGKDTPFWSGTSVGRAQANIGRARDGTTAGGTLANNPFGLADVIGNAGEMIAECAVETERAGPPPAEPPACKRIVKGGAWNSPPAAGRHAARAYLADGASTNFIGFRVAREVDERDNDKLLTLAQRRALAKVEREDAEIKAKEIEDAEAAKRAAREPKVKKEDPKAKKK